MWICIHFLKLWYPWIEHWAPGNEKYHLDCHKEVTHPRGIAKPSNHITLPQIIVLLHSSMHCRNGEMVTAVNEWLCWWLFPASNIWFQQRFHNVGRKLWKLWQIKLLQHIVSMLPQNVVRKHLHNIMATFIHSFWLILCSTSAKQMPLTKCVNWINKYKKYFQNGRQNVPTTYQERCGM